jgi:hypothetical protein
VAALWFAGVALSDTRISFEGQSVPVRGARAYVEQDGDVVQRDSPARALWHGFLQVLGGPGSPREVFLLIDGPDFQFVVPCVPTQLARARSFATAICAAGSRPADAPIRRGAGPGFPRATISEQAAGAAREPAPEVPAAQLPSPHPTSNR